MVVDGDQVEAVLLGARASARRRRTRLGRSLCIDMSTIGPTAARRIGAALAERGVALRRRARDGLLAEGRGRHAHDHGRRGADATSSARGRCSRRWASWSSTSGRSGDGQMVKLINNAVAAANTAVVARGAAARQARGLDLDALVTVMKAGSGGSAMLELKERPMREHDYTTLFKLAHMLKDVRLCLEEAEAAGHRVRLRRGDRAILAEADAQGYGDEDFAALLAALEERTGTTL